MDSPNPFGAERPMSSAGAPASPTNSRPPSRVAYMKPRIDAITANPPPGIYDRNIVVHLECVTEGATLLYTTDGSTPYENSDRDHGYRCAKYSSTTGIALAGNGKHIITVVAKASKHVDSRPKRFVYRITADDVTPRPRSEMLRIDALNRQFELVAAKNDGMPYRLAKQASFRAGTLKPVHMALAETSNPRKLEALRKSGLHVELFKINAASTSVHSAYQRIVPPSLSVTVPRDPFKERKASAPESLRSLPDTITYAAPASYAKLERSPSALSDAASGQLVALDALSTKFGALTFASHSPTSRAATPLVNSRRPDSRVTVRSSSSTRLGSSSNSGLPSRPPKGSTMATHSQLAWFESRTNLTAADPGDDREDNMDEARYREQCNLTVAADVARVGRISEKIEKTYAQPVAIAADIASDGRRLLAFIVLAGNAKRTVLRRYLCGVSYIALANALEKRSTTSAVELAALPGNPVSQRELAVALRELTGGSDTDTKISMPTPTLMLLFRYLIWVGRKMPEAILGLSVQFKTDVVAVQAERTVTRVEAVAVVDAYRRARGHHPLALAQLQDAVFTQIKWSEMSDIPLETWTEALRSVPIIDAALSEMQNYAHAMYEHPLSLY